MSPEFFYGLGAAVLLGALIYGTVQWRSRNRGLDTEGQTARNYDAEERDRGEHGRT
jgi:hypothetical protein